MKNFPTVLFLVRAFAKLQRERSVFWPGPFPDAIWPRYDQALLKEKEPLYAAHIFGNKKTQANLEKQKN